MWNPEGTGRGGAKLAVGGAFTLAGNTHASGVAIYDPATGTWTSPAGGIQGEVYALAALPNGDLI
ncbi:MAG: galactose oxidase, partial [bacterium]